MIVKPVLEQLYFQQNNNIMKHIQLFEHFAENIVEGVNFNGSKDADLEDVGAAISKERDADEAELVKIGKEALKAAKPVSLTGKIKEDAPKLIKYLVDAFKRADIELDDKNVYITSSPGIGWDNVIEIPVAKQEGFYFSTVLDYYDLAESGNGKIIIPGAFIEEASGQLDYAVDDINNNGQIVKVATGFKKYLETLNSEKNDLRSK
jgi:hypothetical protein